jgi:hypothetical protein
MTDTALAPVNGADIIERVVIAGDLSKLAPAERVDYYRRTCESLGLNPLTKPFDYINLNGKLTLYARRDCTDQLRKIHRISVSIAARELSGDVYIVTARATTPDYRADESIGAVNIKGLSGEALANAYMKCETKAKRRVTLSIVGLGWLDETEVSTVPDARPVVVTDGGEILPALPAKPAPPVVLGVTSAELEDAPETWPLPATTAAKQEAAPPQPAAAPTAQPAQPRQKLATVKTKQWTQAATDFAASEPYYQANGKTDFYHMIGAAAKVGYTEITDDNLAEVLVALRTYAQEQAQLKAIDGKAA